MKFGRKNQGNPSEIQEKMQFIVDCHDSKALTDRCIVMLGTDLRINLNLNSFTMYLIYSWLSTKNLFYTFFFTDGWLCVEKLQPPVFKSSKMRGKRTCRH